MDLNVLIGLKNAHFLSPLPLTTAGVDKIGIYLSRTRCSVLINSFIVWREKEEICKVLMFRIIGDIPIILNIIVIVKSNKYNRLIQLDTKLQPTFV